MLLVIDVERLKKLAKSRDGRVPLHGAPSVGGMESHFPLAPAVRAEELACGDFNAEVDQRRAEQDNANPPQHANLLLIRRCAAAVKHELWPHERDQALKFARTKRFDEFSRDELAYLAGKARLPEKLTLDTAAETVARFHKAWAKEKKNLPLSKPVSEAIEDNLKKVPIASE